MVPWNIVGRLEVAKQGRGRVVFGAGLMGLGITVAEMKSARLSIENGWKKSNKITILYTIRDSDDEDSPGLPCIERRPLWELYLDIGLGDHGS